MGISQLFGINQFIRKVQFPELVPGLERNFRYTVKSVKTRKNSVGVICRGTRSTVLYVESTQPPLIGVDSYLPYLSRCTSPGVVGVCIVLMTDTYRTNISARKNSNTRTPTKSSPDRGALFQSSVENFGNCNFLYSSRVVCAGLPVLVSCRTSTPLKRYEQHSTLVSILSTVLLSFIFVKSSSTTQYCT